MNLNSNDIMDTVLAIICKHFMKCQPCFILS